MPKEKILLGIPTYGYEWEGGTVEGRVISSTEAIELAHKHGAEIHWDAKAQVPHFTYRDKEDVERLVYLENAYSLAPKLEIVRKHGLGGIALWRLGLEDPAVWPLIREKLR